MSGTAASLRRKIDGARELKSVVTTMKALAASSIGQYERAVQSLREYNRTVELALAACLRACGPLPVSETPQTHRTGADSPFAAVVFGSDQGLVGRFNEVLAEFALREIGEFAGRTQKIWAVGDRIFPLLGGAPPLSVESLPVPASVDAITSLIDRVLIAIDRARAMNGVVEVHVFHNRPLAGSGYAPVGTRLLPLDEIWMAQLRAIPWSGRTAPQIIGTTGSALHALIRENLFAVLFRAAAESLASENASRLAAMQRAERNIEDIAATLERSFHRLRQESIDEELFDVISGYEAAAGAGRGTVGAV